MHSVQRGLQERLFSWAHDLRSNCSWRLLESNLHSAGRSELVGDAHPLFHHDDRVAGGHELDPGGDRRESGGGSGE